MATALKKLRNILTIKSGSVTTDSIRQSNNTNGKLEPELGFKAALDEKTKEVRITVIGARHLPTLFGLTRAEGYIVKIKLFPGKEKFETKLQKQSWPVFNQEFTFQIPNSSKRIEDILSGKFVVFTIYAILEHNKPDQNITTRGSRHSSSSFMNFFNRTSEISRSESVRSSHRVSLYKRRTVGAVTYNLDPRGFTINLKNNVVGTPDMWRIIKSLSSGLIDKDKANESNKGAVELTMTYSISENGLNDMIQLSLSRLRFSIQTMETHENITGSLYVKMKIYEHDVVVSKWRSDKFEPTISHKLDTTTSTFIGTVQQCNLYAVRCEIRLMCRNKLGKKSELGFVVIKQGDAHWEQAFDSPSNAFTMWHNFR